MKKSSIIEEESKIFETGGRESYEYKRKFFYQRQIFL